MPPSRIAFAIGDLASEIIRLMPRDVAAGIRIVLRPDVYARVGRELANYTNMQNFNPESAFLVFGGVRIERGGVDGEYLSSGD